MMFGFALPLALTVVLVPAFVAAPARAAEPSFDCRTAKTARELATCNDAKLAAAEMIRWEVEVPALDPHAFDTIVADILRWRDNPVRARWLALLQPIAAIPRKFAQARETSVRAEIMDEARSVFRSCAALAAS